MKWLLRLACVAALAGCSSKHDGHTAAVPAHQHDTPDAKPGDAHAGHQAATGTTNLMVRTEPGQPKAAEKTGLTLMLHGDGGAMVKDFEVVHE